MAEKETPPHVHIVKVVLREKPTIGERLALLAIGVLAGMLAVAAAVILRAF
jgi:hypothetical protein